MVYLGEISNIPVGIVRLRHTNTGANMGPLAILKFLEGCTLLWKPSRGFSALPIVNIFASIAGELCLKAWQKKKKYLAPAESGLKSAAAVNSARLALRNAFFTQFHEVSYPPQQGPGS